VGGCWYPVTCDVCLSRSGCTLDALTGACVLSTSVPGGASVGNERYFPAGSASYCDASDEHCVDYLSGVKSGVCSGWDSCIASHQCALISTNPTMCQAAFSGFTKSVLIVACALGVLVLFIASIRSRAGIGGLAAFLCRATYERWHERRMRRRREEQEQQRRARAEADPTGLHVTLKLENWRKERDAHAQASGLGPVELECCYIQMPREDRETIATDTDSLPTWDADSFRDSGRASGDSVVDAVGSPVEAPAIEQGGDLDAANAAARSEARQ